MNERQREILKYLSTTDPDKYITLEEIASNTGLVERVVGTECAKLEKSYYVQHGGSQLGEKLKYRITTLGQEQLQQEKHSKRSLILTGLTAYGTVTLAAVTVVLAIVTGMLALDSINQTHLMQQDFDVNNRPWIGATSTEVKDGYFIYSYQNFGKIPNTSGRITKLMQISPISRQDLVSNSNKDILPIIMPTQEMDYTLKIERLDLIIGAKNGTNPLFVGFLLDYQYGDKIGYYGSILKYDKEQGHFVLVESWSE